ncbi:MAG: bacteriophage abortive infection AbiH family protein [Firmicutes bacterium]|nr:bacteriophage abortive infection AbiH family protein [Bacillota bacterium]
MENTLLIIGNGFDLACGLKSKYIDFYNECIKGKAKGFWQELLVFYEKQHSKENPNWCDVEKIIEGTLQDIFVSRFQNLYREAHNMFRHGFYLPKNYDKNPINNYIIRYCVDIIYEILKKGITDEKRHLMILNKYLLTELKDLESQFCEYLNKQLNSTNHAYYTNTIKLFNYIVYNHNMGRVSILNFNYTNPNLSYYTNVHGQLCKEKCKLCKQSNIIFGIDDNAVKNSKCDELRLFSKTYRTLQMADEKVKILPSKEQPLVIKFFGHSLSEADYSYFQSIFDYYNIYENSDVSLKFCYLDYDVKNPNKVKNDTLDAVYKLINSYGATLHNKDQGKNLMHKLFLENRIRIKEIDFKAIK